MDKFKGFLKAYKVFLFLMAISISMLFVSPEIGRKSLSVTKNSALEMLTFLPPIFVLLGLLDVWVKKETMVKYMGEKSGLKGILIAFFLGSAAAGPLYAAFPVAMVLLKKGSKFSNTLIMIGAWSTIKITIIMFEATNMGMKFTVLRFILNIIGISIIAYTTEKLLSKEEKEKIIHNAEMSE